MNTYDASPSTNKVLGGAPSRVEITSADGRWQMWGNAIVVESFEPEEEDIITRNWSWYGPRTVKMTLQMVPDARGYAYTLQDKSVGVMTSKHFPEVSDGK